MMKRHFLPAMSLIFLFFFSSSGLFAAGTVVAKIGGASYGSLAAALAAAGTPGQIRLVADAVWDDACEEVSLPEGIVLESADHGNPALLTVATDMYLDGEFTLQNLRLRFTNEERQIFAGGYTLRIADTVEMEGSLYPFVYGGGSWGEIRGAKLLLEGGHYQDVYGGSAGAVADGSGEAKNITIYFGYKASLADDGQICPGKAGKGMVPNSYLQIHGAGSAAQPLDGISPDFSEILVSGTENSTPAYVYLGDGGNRVYHTLKLGNNANVFFDGRGEISLRSLFLLSSVDEAATAPLLIKNDDSLIRIGDGEPGKIPCKLKVNAGSDDAFSETKPQIEAPVGFSFSLLSPEDYNLLSVGDGVNSWYLQKTLLPLAAPENVYWQDHRLLWDWHGDKGLQAFLLKLYKEDTEVASFTVAAGDRDLDLTTALAKNGPGNYTASVTALGAEGFGDSAAVQSPSLTAELSLLSADGLALAYCAAGPICRLLPTEEQMAAIIARGGLTLPTLPYGYDAYLLEFDDGWIAGKNLRVVLQAPYGYGILTGALFPGTAKSRGFLLGQSEGRLVLAVYKDGEAVAFPGSGYALAAGIAARVEMSAGENYVVYRDGVLLPQSVWDENNGFIHFLTEAGGTFRLGYNEKYFLDLIENAWYAKAMSYMTAREIIKGVGNDRVSPDTNVLRADFLIMVMRSFGIPIESQITDNFADAGSTYYSDYLGTAKKWGIVSGVGGNCFAPRNEITREEMFKMLYGVLLALGRIAPADADLSVYGDYGQIHDWALPAVTALQARGDIGGWDGNLHPGEKAPRSHAVQILYNLLIKQVPDEF